MQPSMRRVTRVLPVPIAETERLVLRHLVRGTQSSTFRVLMNSCLSMKRRCDFSMNVADGTLSISVLRLLQAPCLMRSKTDDPK